jgi:molybdopterin-guanine dinucleotide biosynthesis protein A
MHHAAGIVLCGGRSSRMGRPKAWLPFGDELLLQRVVRILSDIVDPIVVVAAAGQALPALPAGTLIARDEREHLGPLNGLAEGLTVLEGRAKVAYLSSCDVPFLKPAFVRRVLERMGDASVCIPDVGGYKHPLAAAYRLDVMAAARTLLRENRLRPVFLTEVERTRVLTETDFRDVDSDLSSLRNLNTPEEYASALREIGQAPVGPA